MNYCYINSTQLPTWFSYNMVYRDKIVKTDTILSRFYIAYDFDNTDITIPWTLDPAVSSFFNLFKSLFTSHNSFTFTDYNGSQWLVILTKFEWKEANGVYSLNGEFSVINII